VVGVAGRYSTHFDFGEKKKKILHVGLNYSRRWTSDEAVTYAQRPESHIAPFFVDTGAILARWVDTGLFEAAYINGPFSAQTEVVVAGVKPNEGPRPVFYGFYVSGAYTLTGESRPYRRRLGIIGGISPTRSWREGGRGALEIALRFSRINLDSQEVRGGALNDGSFALNWYATPHIKTSFNVIRAARRSWDPVWLFQGRLQVMY
jgi:phosphate-selective porin OprO/OprP